MSGDVVEALARSLLYEGYLLYPYRPDALKNRHRFTFGGVYPKSWCQAGRGSDASSCRTECLVVGDASQVEIEIRFLHVREQRGELSAVERRLRVAEAPLVELAGMRRDFRIAAEEQEGFRQLELAGSAEVGTTRAGENATRLSIEIENAATPTLPTGRHARDEVLLSTFAALHTLVRVEGAELCSLLEPEPGLEAAALACRNRGTFPVLVGKAGDRQRLLSSPIMLYDYPSVAEESETDLFDATEIDEILSLRILTLTDEEKDAVRRGDPHAARLLARVEALGPEAFARMHGARRELGSVGKRALAPGDRVRIRSRRQADAFDLALTGRDAVIETLEVDLEGRILCAVTLDDDPGRDLGRLGFPGHRFFFGPEELEPLT
jgi:hypothetical protein